ncbi:MAG: MarR family transcriptional regulator [Gammaproteobacteria bacterium]|nr:MarR family transcriptional regulator [Gammaproteobacteria bacterium]
MKPTPLMQKYILHWGEMGTRWGVNRTVSQIHALLYLTPEALNAEDIAEMLSIARSNVSTSIKELQSWGLVAVEPVLGDRRDYFVARGDTWEMLMTIMEERKKRELEPTLTLLRQCVLEMEADKETPQQVKDKIEAMLSFVSTLTEWFDQIKGLPRSTLVTLMKMGATIAKLVPSRRGKSGNGG